MHPGGSAYAQAVAEINALQGGTTPLAYSAPPATQSNPLMPQAAPQMPGLVPKYEQPAYSPPPPPAYSPPPATQSSPLIPQGQGALLSAGDIADNARNAQAVYDNAAREAARIDSLKSNLARGDNIQVSAADRQALAAPPPPPLGTRPEFNPIIPTGQGSFNGGAADPALIAAAESAARATGTQDALEQYRIALNNMIYGTAPTGVKPSFGEGLAAIYQNQLGRAPDQEGIDYWGNAFNSGQQTLQQIAQNVAKHTGATSLYIDDDKMFIGNEWSPQALANRGLAKQGLPMLTPAGAPYNPLVPMSPENRLQTVDDWSGYNATLSTQSPQTTDDPAYERYAQQAYANINPAAPGTNINPGGVGHNNPPPGPLPTAPRGLPAATLPPPTGRAPTATLPPTAPPTTRPPTRSAAEYPYSSPINRQLAAANDQRATPMTQPVGYASNNPLLGRFGTARLGEYTGARETPGNVPAPFIPTTNPLPGIINGAGNTNASSVVNASNPPPEKSSLPTIAGVPAAAIVPIAGAALSLIGKSGQELVNGLAQLPGGAAALSLFGLSAGDAEGLELGPDGIRAISPTAENASLAARFNQALKPTFANVAGAGLAALPDILAGNYTEGAGAGIGSYAGGAAGVAAGAGVGGIVGNFVIPGLGSIVGAYIGRKVGGLFGPGGSVGPNAGGYMAFDPVTGQLYGGVADEDNKGDDQLGFVRKFMDGVATVVNEANASTGGKYVGTYNNARPPAYVEVLRGKINIYDENGVKRVFEGNQIEDAFKHAVDVSTRHSALQLPG